MSRIRLFVLLTYAPVVLGANVPRKQSTLQARTVRPGLANYLDCRQKRAAMLQKTNLTKTNLTANGTLPGTGMHPAVTKAQMTDNPKAYMDGFSLTGCIKDYMFYHGDKHYDNRFSYALENSSHVSITFYSDLTPKEDQEAMTPDICFDFCRVQKDMLFFGINNGRTCYCAPWVRPMASDDEVCDSTCEGANDVLCGSKDKSSVFEMHLCSDTAEQLVLSVNAFTNVTAVVKTLGDEMKAAAALVVTDSNDLQEKWGKAGDAPVAALFQVATAAASQAKNLATQALQFEAAQAALVASADALKGKDMSLFENANKADDIMVDIGKNKLIAEKYNTNLKDTAESFMPPLFGEFTLNTTGASKQYLPIMTWITNSTNNPPATCGGKLAALHTGLTKDGCAAKCDSIAYSGAWTSCVGFLYVPGAAKSEMKGLPDSYCFMFSRFTSVQYYTKPGCNGTTFLQSQREHSGTMCYGRSTAFSFHGGSTPIGDETPKEADSRCMPQ